MALSLTNNNHLITNSTTSPSIFPFAGQFGSAIWFYMPATVSVEQMLCYWDTAGADSSRFAWSLTTDKRFRVFSSTAAGVNASATSAVLATGWHSFTCSKNSLAASFANEIDDNASAFNLAAANSFDTALTRLFIGRAADGTQRADTKLSWFFVSTSNLDATEQTNWRNAGVARTPVGIINGTVGSVGFVNSLTAASGTVVLGCGREPVFVDDQDVTGVAWSQSAFDAIPAIRNGGVLYFNGNVDLLMNSDSFGMINTARVGLHLANEYARAAGASIKKIVAGWNTTNHSSGFPLDYTLNATGTLNGAVDYNNDYAWNKGALADVQMAVPLGDPGFDINLQSGTAGTSLVSIVAGNPGVYTGPLAAWLTNGNNIRFKPILRRGINYVANGAAVTYQGNGTVPAGQPTTDVTVSSSIATLAIDVPSDNWAAVVDSDFQIVGCIADNRSVLEGIGFGTIADSTWSTGGHSVDTPSTGTAAAAKTYSHNEAKGIYSAFYDSSKKLIFVLSIAYDNNSLDDWVDAIDIRCAALGITNYGFLIISQFIHNIGGGSSSLTADRATMHTFVTNADTLAQADTRICHVNLYKLTEGCYFHDTTDFSDAVDANDANGPQQNFLARYDTTYSTSWATNAGRDMLDASNLHLGSSNAAQFMAEVVARTIVANASEEPENDSEFTNPASSITHSMAGNITYGPADGPVGAITLLAN